MQELPEPGWLSALIAAAWAWGSGVWAWLMEAGGTELRAHGLGTVALRLGVALACGAAIGFERERRHRAAGLRTHVLVALASAMFAVIAGELLAAPTMGAEHLRIDPLRLIEAVTGGVAFLAAGLIIVARGRVRGLTTGAGMWLAGAIGLAAGLGYFQIALLGTGFALAVLVALRWIEAGVIPSRKNRGTGPPGEGEG